MPMPTSTSGPLARLTRRPCPSAPRVQAHQPYSCIAAKTPCNSTWEYSLASKKNHAYSDTMPSPMGQHQLFCRTVSQTAITPSSEAISSRSDMAVAGGE